MLYIWLDLSRYNYIYAISGYMTICYICMYMNICAMYYMTIYDYIWLYMTIYVLYMPIYAIYAYIGFKWLYMTICDYIWLYMTIYAVYMIYMFIYAIYVIYDSMCYKWLYMTIYAIYDYICYIGYISEYIFILYHIDLSIDLFNRQIYLSINFSIGRFICRLIFSIGRSF